MSRVVRRVASVVVVLLLAGGAQALAKSIAGHTRFHHALSAKQIHHVARANRVIVVLKTQRRGRLATAASVRARSAAVRRQQRPLVASVARAGGAVTHRFTTLNAFSARISNAER